MDPSSKLCPFNEFQSCIGNRCALYLKFGETQVGGEAFNTDIVSLFPSFPCALSVSGTKAVLDYATPGAKPG